MSFVIAQNFKTYFNRYTVCDQGCVKGHIVTSTEEWWNRSSSYYSVSSTHTQWWMTFFNCVTVDPREYNNPGFAPGWPGEYETYHYWFVSPMDSWPVLWSDVNQGYQSWVKQWSDWTESGWYAGTLVGQYIFPKT
jgi:hypothetical protein